MPFDISQPHGVVTGRGFGAAFVQGGTVYKSDGTAWTAPAGSADVLVNVTPAGDPSTTKTLNLTTTLAAITGSGGTSILFGVVIPTDSVTGNDGDYYIDTAHGMFYGPRTAGAWGDGWAMTKSTAATSGGELLMSNGVSSQGNTSWAAPGPSTTNGFTSRSQAVLVGGRVTVSTNKQVSAGHSIILTIQALGTVTVGQPLWLENVVPGTGFDIVSADATDTSTIGWLIF